MKKLSYLLGGTDDSMPSIIDKEQKIIKKIQELVPEIMELKFGCKVILDGDLKTVGDCVNFVSDDEYYFAGCGCCSGYLKPDTLEILGRDITLEDVLLTIKEKHKNDDDFSYELEAFKQLLFTSFENWQLNKPFHLQSQETKDFIGDLILTK